ncbi:MAG: chlorite dismutase family protein, partial [Phycisphaeraceae bacterium]
DAHDPFGVALLTIREDPSFFVADLPALLRDSPFAQLRQKPQYTMFGRTYALGYEQDLEETLFTRPTRTALNADWPWVIWYPLRRKGAFEQLDAERQREILMEHGRIGFRFGRADQAHDIRLACHGLDPHDNDFVIGLTGKALHPLSAVVQAMRKTTQTSQYIERLGPFFVGRALWQSESRRETHA